MSLSGLTEIERDRLAEAGFGPTLVAAVAAEAETLRFLWLRRTGFSVVTGVAGAAGAAAVGNILGEAIGPLGVWVPVAITLLIAALSLAPWWEIERMKARDRARWAARKLAAHAVSADPDDDEDEDWTTLQSLAQTADGARSTQEALLSLADALEADRAESDLAALFTRGEEADSGRSDEAADPPPGPAQASTAARRPNPAPSRMQTAPARAMTPDGRARLLDAARGAVIIAALIALTVLLLVRDRLGA